MWPGSDDEYDAIALTNRHGGPAGVYYTGRVSTRDAERVGQLLIEADAFGGPNGAEILLDREGGAAVVSVFCAAVPPDDVLDELFPPLRRRLSDEVFDGGPVVIEICSQDVKLVMRKVQRNVRKRYG